MHKFITYITSVDVYYVFVLRIYKYTMLVKMWINGREIMGTGIGESSVWAPTQNNLRSKYVKGWTTLNICHKYFAKFYTDTVSQLIFAVTNFYELDGINSRKLIFTNTISFV